MSEIFSAKDVTKAYNKNIVLKHVNMNVNNLDIYGFVGKNGAGKSTFLKILFGLISEDSGELSLMGSKNKKETTKNRSNLSGIIEIPSFYTHLTAHENLTAYCILRAIDKKRISSALEQVGLLHEKNKKVGKFSLGMKQRLGIARAICSDATLIVLDEPTNGLDPEGIVEFRGIISRLNQEQGKTFIISSHYITELQKICTRFGLLVNGIISEELTSNDLGEKIQSSITLTLANVNDGEELLRSSFPNLGIARNENSLIISKAENNLGEILALLSSKNITIKDVQNQTQSIEEYIVNAIKG